MGSVPSPPRSRGIQRRNRPARARPSTRDIDSRRFRSLSNTDVSISGASAWTASRNGNATVSDIDYLSLVSARAHWTASDCVEVIGGVWPRRRARSEHIWSDRRSRDTPGFDLDWQVVERRPGFQIIRNSDRQSWWSKGLNAGPDGAQPRTRRRSHFVRLRYKKGRRPPDPLILSFYFSLRGDQITQLIIVHNKTEV